MKTRKQTTPSEAGRILAAESKLIDQIAAACLRKQVETGMSDDRTANMARNMVRDAAAAGCKIHKLATFTRDTLETIRDYRELNATRGLHICYR